MKADILGERVRKLEVMLAFNMGDEYRGCLETIREATRKIKTESNPKRGY